MSKRSRQAWCQFFIINYPLCSNNSARSHTTRTEIKNGIAINSCNGERAALKMQTLLICHMDFIIRVAKQPPSKANREKVNVYYSCLKLNWLLYNRRLNDVLMILTVSKAETFRVLCLILWANRIVQLNRWDEMIIGSRPKSIDNVSIGW